MSDEPTHKTEEDEVSVDAIGLPAFLETGNDICLNDESVPGTESQGLESALALTIDDDQNMSADTQERELLRFNANDVSRCAVPCSTFQCLHQHSLLDSQTQLRELKNWTFHKLLCTISDNTSTEDFEKLKLFFKDELGNARAFEKITSTTLLLTALIHRDLLSSDNLIYLQAALYNVRNMELVRLCAEYARKERDAFHFYRCPEEGNLGSQQSLIKVHVKGYNRLSRLQLETIKLTISRLIFLPMEHITLVGIEPSASFILVFLLPKEYASYFKDLLEEDITLFDQISDHGIDSILVENVTYRPKDNLSRKTETCQDFQRQTHSLPVSTSLLSETCTFEHQQMQTENAEKDQKKKTFDTCHNLIPKTMTSIKTKTFDGSQWNFEAFNQLKI